MKIRWDELTRAQQRKYESKYRRIKRSRNRQVVRQSKREDQSRLEIFRAQAQRERIAEKYSRRVAIAHNRHVPTAFMARWVPVKGCGCGDCERLRVDGWEDKRT